MTTKQWPPAREDDYPKGDYNQCKKCGRRMHILFNMRWCPYCDKSKEEREKENSEANESKWYDRWYRFK